MRRPSLTCGVLAVIGLVALIMHTGSCEAGAESAQGRRGSWAQVTDILARVQPPTFPDRNFRVTEYGAVGDGVTECRDAFAAAIRACDEGGGGQVVVPEGTYLVNGPIHLVDNMNLHLAEGACVKFGTDPADYLPPVLTRWECTRLYNYSPLVYARGRRNVALTGMGTLDGQAKETWCRWTAKDDADVAASRRMNLEGVPVAERVFGEGHYLRPSMVQFYECENVLVEGVRILDAPFWCVHPVFSKNVTVRNIRFTSHNPNNDGIDIDSCESVHIHDVIFDNGDDCIAIKSGRGPEGRALRKPTRNVYIHDCIFNAYTAIAIGSEMGGSVYNIFAENCEARSEIKRAFRIKGNRTRGGEVSHIRYRNMRFLNAWEEMIDLTTRYGGMIPGAPETFPPVYHDIRYERIHAEGPCKIALNITGEPDEPIRDVVLSDVIVEKAERRRNVEHVANLVLQNVELVGERQEPNADNLPPDVYAGPDLDLNGAGEAVALKGSVDDDGIGRGALQCYWSVIQGDADAVAIEDPAAAQTRATFDQEGVYVLKLEASDGRLSGYHFAVVKVGDQPEGMQGVSMPIEGLAGGEG